MNDETEFGGRANTPSPETNDAPEAADSTSAAQPAEQQPAQPTQPVQSAQPAQPTQPAQPAQQPYAWQGAAVPPQDTRQRQTPPQPAYASAQNGYRWDYGSMNANAAPRAPKKKNRGLRVFLILLAVIVLAVLSVFSAAGIYRLVTGETLFPGASSSATSTPDDLPSSESEGSLSAQEGGSMPEIEIAPKPHESTNVQIGDQMTPKDIYRLCSPSVVGVLSYYDLTYTNTAQGSGIVLSEDGYIITNAHVVSGAVSYEIVLPSGEYYTADLVGYDSQTDIAVLKARDVTGLTPATFGDSDQLVVGEMVVAIGNPDGLNLATSQTVGYVSALNRLIQTESSYTMECIQSDAAINPGSSGGPLINEYGQVIGINSAKLADVDFEGIGFSIPINTALPIVQQLIENGKVTGRAMLGITTKQYITAEMASYYGIPTGIVIDAFADGSDLPSKGVRAGDIITQVGGVAIETVGDCSNVLRNYRPGEAVELTIFRITNSATYAGESFTVTIVLLGS